MARVELEEYHRLTFWNFAEHRLVSGRIVIFGAPSVKRQRALARFRI